MQQHSQGSNGASAEEEEPGRDESLVHVSSPKVRGRPEARGVCIVYTPSPWVHAWAGFCLLLALHNGIARELHKDDCLPGSAGERLEGCLQA